MAWANVENKSYVHLVCWSRSESSLLAEQESWTTTLPVLKLEDSRHIFAVSHKGNSRHCLMTRTVPVTPQLRLELITTSICLCWQEERPIQKALAAGAPHTSPKTACQGMCFLSELPWQHADGAFGYSVGNCHIITVWSQLPLHMWDLPPASAWGQAPPMVWCPFPVQPGYFQSLVGQWEWRKLILSASPCHGFKG